MTKFYFRIAVIVLLMLLAVWAGRWLGRVTAPRRLPPEIYHATVPQPRLEPAPAEDSSEEGKGEDPFFFEVYVGPGAELESVAREVTMAGEAGLRQFIVAAPYLWDEDWGELDHAIGFILERVPNASLLLQLDLNPPASWTSRRPAEVSTATDGGVVLPSVGSRAWLDDTKERLAMLGPHVAEQSYAGRITGVVLTALEDGRWYRRNGYDHSGANISAFRAWLGKKYGDDARLRATWGDQNATIEQAEVPERPDDRTTVQVFFPRPAMQRHVDYLEYVSETTADAIAELAAHVKTTWGPRTQVFAAYGYGFEATWNDAGHFALMNIVDSEVDGFIGPVSYFDRGLGGVGGFVAAVDSVTAHGKRWLLEDDTRTGIGRNGNGVVERPLGLRVNDLLNVYRRNFASAALHGLPMAWADATGAGNLLDEELWDEFGTLRATRRRMDTGTPPGLVDETLMVVLDEASRFYQQCGPPLNEWLLHGGAAAARRAGVSHRFVYLRDVLDGRTGGAKVYLFLNAFAIDERDRAELHRLLAAEGACAVWLYAPGVVGPEGPAENVSALTRFSVKPFEKPAPSGSLYAIGGNWVRLNERFGAGGEWFPLFSIEDEHADVLAYYAESSRASVAVKFLEEGWTSVLVCEPVLPSDLLREVLDILEIPVAVKPRNGTARDVVQLSGAYLMIHAGEAGERTIDAGAPADVTDVFNPKVGWGRKRLFSVMMGRGETRLYEVRAAEDAP